LIIVDSPRRFSLTYWLPVYDVKLASGTASRRRLVSKRQVPGETGMPENNYTLYSGAEPYFELVRKALGDLVDGEHFFDIVADDIVYEVRYDLGWPRVVRGRTDLMDQFEGYVGSIRLRSADKLIVNKADNGRVVVIEYEIHGTILATGATYENRFCSIIELAWNALTANGQ
jgi:uncharacterized protein